MIELINGDCLEVMAGMDDNSVDFVFTDPPYGHNNNNGDLISRWEAALGRGAYVAERDDRPILNDGIEAGDLFRAALVEIRRLLKPGACCCCCCGGGGPDPQFARWSLWMDEILGFKQMVVWDKGPMGMGWHYRRSYEVVLVGEKPGAKCKWHDTTNRIENIIRGIPKIIPQASDHPTPKPEQLVAFFLGLHTLPGDLVLDPFGGGGTTAAVCAKLLRSCISIELDPKYHAMSQRRLATPDMLTGIETQ